jgi:glyoxylase I family protein
MSLDLRGVTTLLGVYDMPTSVRFYRDLLGFQVVSTSPILGEDYFHWALLRLGAAQFMLNTNFESNDERPAQSDVGRNAAHRDVCQYFECSDLDGAYEELRSKGVDAKRPTVASYGMRQLQIVDPDGYGICFQWPTAN